MGRGANRGNLGGAHGVTAHTLTERKIGLSALCTDRCFNALRVLGICTHFNIFDHVVIFQRLSQCLNCNFYLIVDIMNKGRSHLKRM